MADIGPNAISTLSQASQYQSDATSQSNLFTSSPYQTDNAPKPALPTQAYLDEIKAKQNGSASVKPPVPSTGFAPTIIRSQQRVSPTLPTVQQPIQEIQKPQFTTPLKQGIVSSATYPSADTSRGPFFQPTVDIQRTTPFQETTSIPMYQKTLYNANEIVYDPNRNKGVYETARFGATTLANVPGEVESVTRGVAYVISPTAREKIKSGEVPRTFQKYEYKAPIQVRSDFNKKLLELAAENPLKAGAIVTAAPVASSLIAGTAVIGEASGAAYRSQANISETEDKEVRNLIMTYYQQNPVYGIFSPFKTNFYRAENFKPGAAFFEKTFAGGPGGERLENAQTYVYLSLLKRGYSQEDAERMAVEGTKTYKGDVLANLVTIGVGGVTSNVIGARGIQAAESSKYVQNLKGIPALSTSQNFVAKYLSKKPAAQWLAKPENAKWLATRTAGMFPAGVYEGTAYIGGQAGFVQQREVTPKEYAVAGIIGGASATAGQLILEAGLPRLYTGQVQHPKRQVKLFGETYKSELPTGREAVFYTFDPTEPLGDTISQLVGKAAPRVKGVFTFPFTKEGSPVSYSAVEDIKNKIGKFGTYTETQTTGQTQLQTKTQPLSESMTQTKAKTPPITKTYVLPSTRPGTTPITESKIVSDMTPIPETIPQPITEVKPLTYPMTEPLPQTAPQVKPYVDPLLRFPWSIPPGTQVGRGGRRGKEWIIKNPVRDLGVEYFTGLKSKNLRGKI